MLVRIIILMYIKFKASNFSFNLINQKKKQRSQQLSVNTSTTQVISTNINQNIKICNKKLFNYFFKFKKIYKQTVITFYKLAITDIKQDF